MNLLDMIVKQGGGSLVGQMAKELGLSEQQTRAAVEQMTPALSRGIQRNAGRPGGLDSLLDALESGNHGRYVDEPQQLGRSSTVEDGKRILGHILGSKDVSRNVAGRAAQQTGIGSELLKQLLPMLAAAAMGSLAKQRQEGALPIERSSGRAAAPSPASGGAFDMLSRVLDADRDGSALDDLLDLGKRFF